MSGQGAAIGAATGATYALATGKDPIKYAMIGGAVGGAGPGAASALGLGGTAAAGAGTAGAAAGGAAGSLGASGSALTGAGASTAANTAFMNAAGVNAGANATMGASQAAAAAPGIFAPPVGGYQSLTAGMQQPLTYEQATATGLQRPYGTFESLLNPNIESSSTAPTFMEQLGSGAGQLGQYAQQNPALTQMAAQSAQQMMQQPQRQASPPGLLRGSPSQVATPQYQVGIPKVSLI